MLCQHHSTKSSIQVSASNNIGIYMNKDENIEEDKITIEYSGIDILSSDNKKGDKLLEKHIYLIKINILDV